MNYFILKEIVSKKDNNHYYKIGIRVYKNGLKVFWDFISPKIFTSLLKCGVIEKSVKSNYCETFFIKVVDF